MTFNFKFWKKKKFNFWAFIYIFKKNKIKYMGSFLSSTSSTPNHQTNKKQWVRLDSPKFL